MTRVALHLRRNASAVRAEWIKLRTVSSSGWLLLAFAVVTTTVSSAVVAVEKYSSASCAVDTTKVSLTGVQVRQAAVAILAVMVIGGEYGSGMIRVTRPRCRGDRSCWAPRPPPSRS